MKSILIYVMFFFVLISNIPLSSRALLAVESFSPQSNVTLSRDSLARHIIILSSDSLEGRGTGSRGERLAAQYIARELEKNNIAPFGDEGSYFQSIPMHGSIPLHLSEMQLYLSNKILDLRYGTQYLLYKTGAQTFVPKPVDLVFAGYGIVAPEYDYNDYHTIDVRDKIVVFLSGEPYSDDASYFAGNEPTIYSYAESKQRIAISRGARGSMMILNPREENYHSWDYLVKTFSFEDVTLAYTVSSHLYLIANTSLAKIVFKNSPCSLDKVLELDRENKLVSFPMHAGLSFKGRFLERDFLSQNVLGIIPGSDKDKRDQYLLLSAHYDHLGIGPAVAGDSIYNGALDNAIGVAGLLEISRLLKAGPPPKRSVLFLFTSGEEKGLLGSTYYVDHPPVPLYKTIANINIDGLASFDETRDMIALGAEFSTFRKIITEATRNTGIFLSPVPPNVYAFESFTRSDQIAFAMAGIPSVLFMEGMDYLHHSREEGEQNWRDWMENIYHSPQDDLGQPINLAASQQHAEFIYTVIRWLADSDEAPQWHSGSIFKQARQQSKAEKR